jgi:hypothetical protein
LEAVEKVVKHVFIREDLLRMLSAGTCIRAFLGVF